MRHKYIHVAIEGSSNIGDNAITFCIREELKKRNVEHIPQSFNFSQKKAGIKTTLKKKSKIYLFLKQNRLVKFIYDVFFIPLSNVKSIVTYFRKLKRSEGVIIGGGNLLMGLDLVFPIQLFTYVVIARILNKEVRVMFVGYGPFDTKFSQFIINASIRLSQEVVFRSQSIPSKIKNRKGVRVACDPVLYLSDILISQSPDTSYDIGISIFPYQNPVMFVNGSQEKYERYIQNFVKIINDLTHLDHSVILYVTDFELDKNSLMDVYNKVNRDKVHCRIPKSVEELVDITTSCKVLLTTRMHSAIFALTYGVPVIALSWQNKVSSLFDDLNLSRYCMDIDCIGEETIVSKAVTALLGDEMMQTKYRIEVRDSLEVTKVKYDISYQGL